MKRLVIRAPNWLGDVVMALPAMAAVRARFADAHVAVAAIPSIAPLFEEETSAAPDSVVTLADRDAEIAALRDGGFDAILLFPNSFRSALTARRAGIAERWGYGAGLRRLLLTRAVTRPRGRRHQSDYYRELVKGLGIPPTVSEPSIVPRPATLARADALLASHGISAPRPASRTWRPARAGPSVSRRAPPTVTPNAGRRGWWPRRSSVYHGRPAFAACSSAPAAIATRAVR